MPWVTVGPPPRSSGKPIASTPSPSLACEEWPSGTGIRSESATRMIARSRFAAVPMTVPLTADLCRPSLNETVTFRAPRMTWLFVRITPRRSITTPEPSPWLPLNPTVRTLTTPGSTRATTSAVLAPRGALVEAEGAAAVVVVRVTVTTVVTLFDD